VLMFENVSQKQQHLLHHRLTSACQTPPPSARPCRSTDMGLGG
jgi:hypothetical protein